MIPEVVIASYEEADRILRKSEHGFVKNLVSIGDVGTKPPSAYHIARVRKMRIEFDDVSEESSVKHGYTLPSEQDVAAIIRFAEGIKGKALFHCVAGISRSSAAALIFMTMQLPKGSERAAAQFIKALKNDTCPNRKMIEHADKLLDRKGQMMWAVAEVFYGGRGNE